MLKLVQCVKGKGDIELLEFRHYWDEYRRRLETMLGEVGATRIDFSTALAVEDNLRLMVSRGTREPYDGVVEIYFEDPRVLHEGLKDGPGRQLVDELRAFQEEFIDLERSTFFFAIDDAAE